MRAEGYGVESICEVPREQVPQVAPRSHRAWKSQPACAAETDAQLLDKLRQGADQRA